MSITWIRRVRCAWRARRLLADTALLADAYRRMVAALAHEGGFDEDVFATAYQTRQLIGARLDEAETYAWASGTPNRRMLDRREHLVAVIDKADTLMDEARTRYNEMVLLEYEANGMDANLLEHARRIIADTGELLGGIEVMRPGGEQ